LGNTEQNLKEAFAGESQANRKYLAFAKKADEEGTPPKDPKYEYGDVDAE